ncbi:MAG: hypothetical protein WDN49_16875 [Acetobacteraceae bacterium]
MLSGNTVTSSARSVPSGIGAVAVPMKLFGLMADSGAWVTPSTLASSARMTSTMSPPRILSSSVLPLTAVSVPRVRGGAWA